MSLISRGARPPKPAATIVAAEILGLVRQGKIGLDFLDPDDCRAEWTPDAVMKIAGAILQQDYDQVKEFIEEFIRPYEMRDILRHHPEYRRFVSDYEADQRQFEADMAAEIHEDNRQRTLAAQGR